MLREKTKHWVRIGLTYLSIVGLATIGLLNLIMYRSNISETEDLLSSIIFIALIISLLIRIFKISKGSTTLIILADFYISLMAFTAILSDDLKETLIGIFTEPTTMAILGGIAIVIWDWAIRIKKIKTLTGNHS